jgi:hypothetical protein
MTKYDQLAHRLFSCAKNCGAEGWYIVPSMLAQEFEIETRHVRESLIRWAKEQLISLEANTSNGFQPFTDWQNADDFFEHGSQVGHVRVKLLSAGDEYLERLDEIEHRPIGFRANVG